MHHATMFLCEPKKLEKPQLSFSERCGFGTRVSRTYGDYSLCVDHLRSRLIRIDPLATGDERTTRIGRYADRLAIQFF